MSSFLDIEAIAKEMSQLIRSGVFIIPALAKNYITVTPRTKISLLVYGNGQVKSTIRDGKEGERNLPTSRMNHK